MQYIFLAHHLVKPRIFLHYSPRYKCLVLASYRIPFSMFGGESQKRRRKVEHATVRPQCRGTIRCVRRFNTEKQKSTDVCDVLSVVTRFQDSKRGAPKSEDPLHDFWQETRHKNNHDRKRHWEAFAFASNDKHLVSSTTLVLLSLVHHHLK